MEENLFSREEIRNLEKAARAKDKKQLMQWASKLSNDMRMYYYKQNQELIGKQINTFMVTIAYILHFSETTHFNNDQIHEFIDDLYTTFEMFSTGEYSVEDYKKQLLDDGLNIEFKGETI